MHDLKVSSPPVISTRLPRSGPFGANSMIWLFLVAGAFLVAEVTPALLRIPLGADEITYIARTSVQSSGVALPPVHGQGAGLLAAPVTMLTSSLTVVRIWMSVLSAVGLFLAMLCWRGLRPLWVLALAGLILASLAITQDSGVQIYPDWWGALGVLALTGLVLHAVARSLPGRRVLPLIALCCLVIVLMRPQNLVFIMGPAVLAVVFVPGWRQLRVLVAMAAGAAIGCLEWVIGAYVWYGGLATRIHLAGKEPPAFSLYFSLGTQGKVLSGPWYCIPPSGCQGWNMPFESVWWVAFLAVTVLGVWVSWRTAARASALLAAGTALWVIALYSFLVPFGAPRYILPSLALMSVLAADACAWLLRSAPRRKTGIVLACLFLVSGIVSQRIVLQREAAAELTERPFQQQAAMYAREGVQAPCAISSPSTAYFLGCTAPWTGQSMPELLGQTPQGIRGWEPLRVRDGSVVYVPTAATQAQAQLRQAGAQSAPGA